MALPPIYILVLSLKPFAPYTEVAVLGSLALWCAVGLVLDRELTCARAGDRPRALACGLLSGLAFWLHPVAIYYLVAIPAYLLLYLRRAPLVHVALVGLAGFALGALPLWLYNLQSGGATLWLLLGGARGDAAHPAAVLAAWWTADLPRAAGLWNPWADQLPALGAPLAGLYAAAFAWATLRRRRCASGPRPLDATLLLLVLIPVVFAASGFGESALNPWGIDATGRYTLPVWAALAVLLGAFMAALWRRRRGVAVSLAGALLAANLYAWVATDAVRAFQSPYWHKLPADNGPLLALLRAEGVAHVWMNHWAALPLMLDARIAGQPLFAYDWYDVEVGGIDRFPEHRPRMEQATRTAFVLVTDEAEPELVHRLRALGVTYRLHRLRPYVVVLPLSRPVHPAEVLGALDERY